MDSEYCLVSTVTQGYETFDSTAERFQELVSTKLREGWILVGGISNTYNTAYESYRLTQALTRKKKTD